MSEQMEKLVEEIASEVERYGDTEFDYKLEIEAPISSQSLARCIIDRIGKAYADGLPLPREEGRDEIAGDDFIIIPRASRTHIPKGRTIIVLRPEEASGEARNPGS